MSQEKAADKMEPGPDVEAETAEERRLLHCINMAMGCISPLSNNNDERLAWYRLLDAIEGRFPRRALTPGDRAPSSITSG